jgi:hypothetical protein
MNLIYFLENDSVVEYNDFIVNGNYNYKICNAMTTLYIGILI